MEPLVSAATTEEKIKVYRDVLQRIDHLLVDDVDWVAAMATVSCELHQTFDYYDWTGFYRTVSEDLLMVGPYQGPHGCIHIAFSRGVCGTAAATGETQLVPDVNAIDNYIACSNETQSEIVVPIITPGNEVLGVLDVDSDEKDAFSAVDQSHLETLCERLGQRYG